MIVASEPVTKENKDCNQASESEIEEFEYYGHASESTNQANESQDQASGSEDPIMQLQKLPNT